MQKNVEKRRILWYDLVAVNLQWKGGVMVLYDILAEIIVSVVAGVAIHCICKWLDRDDSDSLE